MAKMSVLDLASSFGTDQIVLTIGYDKENLSDSARMKKYRGEFSVDQYGRKIPKHAHGTVNLGDHTASTSIIVKAVLELFDRIVDENLLVRRINMSANHVVNKDSAKKDNYEQLNLFDLMNKQECKEEGVSRKRGKYSKGCFRY